MKTLDQRAVSGFVYSGFALLIAGASLTGCAPKKKPAPATQDPAPVTAVATEPAPVEAAEPEVTDWEARRVELEAGLDSMFKEPQIGSRMKVILKSRKARTGKLLAVMKDNIKMEVSSGEVTLERGSLSVESRVKLFREDYVTLGAQKLIAQEQAEAEGLEYIEPTPEPVPTVEKRPRRNPANDTAKRDALREAVDGRVKAGKEVVPVNEGPTGRVKQVEAYIREQVRNPDSLKFLKWGKVHRHNGEWAVEVKYSAQSSELGRITTTVLVLMRKDGEAYRQVAVHGGLR